MLMKKRHEEEGTHGDEEEGTHGDDEEEKVLTLRCRASARPRGTSPAPPAAWAAPDWLSRCTEEGNTVVSLVVSLASLFYVHQMSLMLTTRDAPIDRPPIDIGRYSLSADRSMLSIRRADRMT